MKNLKVNLLILFICFSLVNGQGQNEETGTPGGAVPNGVTEEIDISPDDVDQTESAFPPAINNETDTSLDDVDQTGNNQNSDYDDGSRTEVMIDNFEDADLWEGKMPRDQGVISVMRREGRPREAKNNDGGENKYVLGAKISFFKTGLSWASISPPRERLIIGLTQKLKLWTLGRSFKHELKALVRDIMGQLHLVSFGRLDHYGWKEMETQTMPDNVKQTRRSFTGRTGIHLNSIVVDCSMDETVGHYYIYLDDLRAEVDPLVSLEEDDMRDDW